MQGSMENPLTNPEAIKAAGASEQFDQARRPFLLPVRGIVGSAICRAMQANGYGDEAKGGALLTPTRQELDLLMPRP